MKEPTSRFSFVRRRPVLFGAIALMTLGGAAAAGQRLYETWYEVEGVMLMDDGSVVEFEGVANVDIGAQPTAATTISVEGQPLPGGATKQNH
jgi:hypothetical protein